MCNFCSCSTESPGCSACALAPWRQGEEREMREEREEGNGVRYRVMSSWSEQMASCHLKLPRCKIPLSAEFKEVLDIKKQWLFKALITCQTGLYEPRFLSQITSPISWPCSLLRKWPSLCHNKLGDGTTCSRGVRAIPIVRCLGLN